MTWSATALSLVGVMLTIQALRGGHVPGGSQIAVSLGYRRFLKMCASRGVPETVAKERIEVERGKIVLLPDNLTPEKQIADTK